MVFFKNEPHFEQLNEDGKMPPEAVLDSAKRNASLEHIKREVLARGKAGVPVAGEPIRTIVTEGLFAWRGRIYSAHKGVLIDALVASADMGLPLADSFKLTVLNIDYRGKGDILRYSEPADLVIVGFVFNGGGGAFTPRRSPHHFRPGIWHDTVAEKIKARVVMTYDKGNEINSDSFEPAPGRKSQFDYHSEQKYGDAYRGILVRKGVLREFSLA